MLRKNFKKRADYADRLDQIGFQYHSVLSSDNERYWTEGVAYEFTLERIEEIESASESLHGICMETVRDIVESGDYPTDLN
jgi:glutathionylspermidine synthase